MKSLVVTILILLFSFCAYAEDSGSRSDLDKLTTAIIERNLQIMKANKITTAIIEHRMRIMESDLKSWVNKKTMDDLSKVPLKKDSVRNLYQKFRSTIVEPPNPNTHTEYSVEEAGEFLARVGRLGRNMHNLLLVLPHKDVTKYGKLIRLMRDVLYYDWKQIPYAIKGNSVRGVYWYTIHNGGVRDAEKEYLRLFGSEYAQD